MPSYVMCERVRENMIGEGLSWTSLIVGRLDGSRVRDLRDESDYSKSDLQECAPYTLGPPLCHPEIKTS